MKILHVGNMANLAYSNTKLLRQNNIQAELLMEKNPKKGSDPIHFDPSLNKKYPEWVHFFDKSKSSWKLDIVKFMRNSNYDLIHAYVEMPIFAYFSRRKFVAQTQGSDFRELALSKTTRGLMLRRSYKKAKAILFFQPDHLPIFSKLKLKNGLFLPPPWDSSFFKFSQSKNENKIFTIFHPANLEWRLKGNDKLIKGFSEFVKNYSNSILVIVDRGVDSKKTHKLVHDLGIEKNIKFIPGPLNSTQLLDFYHKSDVIADQFVLGALGSIGWETFSCGKPLLAFINKKQYLDVYGTEPPLVNSKEPNDICKGLEKLLEKKHRNDIGQQARDWIIENHSSKKFIKKITFLYESILNGKQIGEIQDNW